MKNLWYAFLLVFLFLFPHSSTFAGEVRYDHRWDSNRHYWFKEVYDAYGKLVSSKDLNWPGRGPEMPAEIPRNLRWSQYDASDIKVCRARRGTVGDAWSGLKGEDVWCDEADLEPEYQRPEYREEVAAKQNQAWEAMQRNRLAEEQIEKKVALALQKRAGELERLKEIAREMCFPSETPISIKKKDQYHSVPISALQVGDSVVNCHFELNGRVCETGRVEKIIPNVAHHLFKIFFSEKMIRATDDHPFYVIDKGWVPARELSIDDRLLSISGELVRIQNIESEEGEFEVYNLEVSGNHNFYASEVLVHNCDRFGVPYPEGVEDNGIDQKRSDRNSCSKHHEPNSGIKKTEAFQDEEW